MNRNVIIACDFDNEKQLRDFLVPFKKEKPFLKIGYQLFYATGPEFIRGLVDEGYEIFLDLKLHDIPNTVEHGIKSLVNLGVKFITIHAGGGSEMMRGAMRSVHGSQTKLLAVTQLTSTSQEMIENELLIDRKLNDVVLRYATNALESGVHGVICSPLEAKEIKQKISKNLLVVTPGIRMASSKDDQHRVATPEQARKNGCDYIVVGRPITKASDPIVAYRKIKKTFLGE